MADQKSKKKQEKEIKSQPQEGIVFSGYADHKAKMDKLGPKKPVQQESEEPQYQQQNEPLKNEEYEAVQVLYLIRRQRKISRLP